MIAITLPLWFGYATSIPAKAAPSLPAGFSLVYTSTPLGGASSYNLTDIKYVSQSTGVEAGLFAAGKDGKIAWVPDMGVVVCSAQSPTFVQTQTPASSQSLPQWITRHLALCTYSMCVKHRPQATLGTRGVKGK